MFEINKEEEEEPITNKAIFCKFHKYKQILYFCKDQYCN